MTPELIALHIAAGLGAGRERTCGTKIRYPAEESAVKAATSMNKKPTTRNVLEAYPCAFCREWHVGRHVGRQMSEDELRLAATALGEA